MFIDPMYLLLVGPTMLLAMIAQWMTKSAFDKYSRVPTARRITGAQAAQLLLDRAGIHDVKVVQTEGFLSDHYNPMTKTLALSAPVYSQPSVAAIGVACHEAGHAIQHASHYAPLWARSALVGTARFSSFGMWGMILGLMLGMQGLVMLGAVLFSGVLLFQVVTLPVEFDASARAKRLAFEHGLVTSQEQEGMAKVLNAAALTYVAAAVGSLMTLLYFLMRAGIFSNRD